MYEMNQVSTNSFYIQSPANIGIVKLNDTEVCLIDSGNDKDTGRKVRQILDSNCWRLTAIYNTHSHADHIGGNRYLQNQTGCKIYAPGTECAFTNHPLIEPSFLYGGFPPEDLRHKFLMAQESKTEYLTAEVLPEGMSIIHLPGHSFDMVGFRNADDVIYLADCVLSAETLKKYRIGFIYDVAAYLDTLEKVKTLKANFFIPAHTEVTENIAPLAQMNIDKVHEIAAEILEICKTPMPTENILQRLFNDAGIRMNFEQYMLIGSTARSYLSWLKDTERMEVTFANGLLLWQTVD
jgi:glyoxylase-like metal-dependent hydrolase (beta-lactamase superfamily II)